MPNGRRFDGLPQLLLGLVALAVAILVGAIVVAGAIKAVKRSRDTISVTGSARQPITADLATWSLSIADQDLTPAATSRSLKKSVAKIRAFLRSSGIPDDAISLPPVGSDVTTQRVPGRGKVTAYRLVQTFNITSRDIDTVEKTAANVSTLYEQGLPVSADSIQYVSTELKEARLKALTKATRDAKRRAETIVDGIGGTLGGARKAELGVYQVTPRNSTDVSDYGINDTSSREKDVTAVVTVTFSLH